MAALITTALSCDNKNSASNSPSAQNNGAASIDSESKAENAINWSQSYNKNTEDVQIAKNLLAKNYYVVLDGSGSMRDNGCSGTASKSEASKRALAEFAQAVPQEANLGFAAFDSRGVTERLPLGINNRDMFIQQVNNTRADTDTPLHDAVNLGFTKLKQQAQKQLGYGEYHLVMVTDGIATRGQNPTTIVNDIIDKTPVIIHTIGFCISENHALNQPGRTFYETADNPQELVKSLKQVLAEAETFDAAYEEKH
ncbi:von Willebrand factor type A (vWA) domain-containing protein [Candidatus Magnetoovum chiemensis]|nr:von Willebrand factor type A (vWA) domain-containing protein [Candidatus Magnetoovum chiemensis]